MTSTLLKKLFDLPLDHYQNATADTIRRARLLYILTVNNVGSFIGLVVYLLFTKLTFPSMFVGLLLGFMWSIGPVPVMLLRKGYFRSSRLMYWVSLVVIEIASIWFSGGGQSPLLMVALLMIVTMTSLLFSVWFSIPTLIGCALVLTATMSGADVTLGMRDALNLNGSTRILLAYNAIHLLLIGGLINVGYIQMHVALSNVDKHRKQIAESEARYRRFTETTKDTIVVLNDRGIVQFVNQSVLPMFGYSQADLVGKTIEELMPVELREAHKRGFARYLLSGKRTLDWDFVEVPGLHKSGKGLNLEMAFTEYTEDDERFYIGFIRNVTEQKQAESALLHASKMESLGILAGGIAHDFNNLLVGMLGQTSLISRKLESDSPIHKHVDRVLFAAKRAADLTQQMLAYSGQGQFTVESISLNTLVRENLALFQTSIPDTVDLVASLRPNLPTIKADPTQMQQIFMNLIINAAQAIQGTRGAVTVNTGAVRIDEQFVLPGFKWMSEAAPGKYVFVEVADTGVGMTTGMLGQIFDPFFTTKEAGTGLGLAAVLGIVNSHDGGLAVNSIIGQGTAFRLFFPCEALPQTNSLVNQEPELVLA